MNEVIEESLEQALVSIVIPTFNRGGRLEKAINSVLNQEYKNIEVIVVDDNNPGSSERENTEKIVNSFSSNPRIKYLKHSKNMGGAVARNNGIKKSKGLFVGFLDDDDIFLQGKLEKQVKFLLNHEEFNAVYCGSKELEEVIKPVIYGNLAKELLQFKTAMATSTLLFHREALLAINGFDESFRRHQDYELLLRYFTKGYKIGVIPEVLVQRGENDGENAVHGRELELLKRNFLSQFNSLLIEIDRGKNGFFKDIHCKNFSRVVIDYFVRGNYRDGSRLFREQYELFGFSFIKEFFIQFFILLKKKVISKRF